MLIKEIKKYFKTEILSVIFIFGGEGRGENKQKV